MFTKLIGLTFFAVVLLCSFVSVSAQDFDRVQFTAVKVTDNIYMLQGAGGNIGLSFGDDGIFIIDDQFAPLHEKLIAKIDELTKGKVPESANTFLINTHFHPDHTGGNELMGKTGTIIVAHDNVRNRIAVEQSVPFFNRTSPPVPGIGLPVITFEQGITLHLNDDSVKIMHVGPAHTDGDAVVHFTKADVIHAGDILFTDSYPFIDLDNGGSVAGVIKAVEKILELATDQTRIISGHGGIIDKVGLESYHKMLSTIFESVSAMVKDSKTLEQIVASKPTDQFDAHYNGMISNEAFLGLLYRDLTE
jgi:glyoxylase-like metal-dependent hydrolase (beta-lactamase superfamily II)